MSSIVQIKDSDYDGLQSLRVYGNTVQNLWVNPSGTNGGVTVTANENGTISISGDFDGTSVNAASDYIYALRPSTQYALSVNKSVINNSGGYFALQQFDADGTIISGSSKFVGYGNTLSITFTTDASMSKCRCAFYANSNAVIVSGTYRVMLNEGDTAEPWCPPGLNGVDELSIVTAGKNLLEPQAYLGNYTYGIALGIRDAERRTEISLPHTTAGSYQGVAFYFEAKAGNSYTFTQHNAPAGAVLKLQQFYPKQESVSATGTGKYTGVYAVGSFSSGATFTFENDGLVVVLSALEGTGTATWPADFSMQVELGSTATAYEPPAVTTTPIDLQGHTLNALPDGTHDELHIDGGGNVVLEKRCVVASAPTAEGSWQYAADIVRASFALPSAGPASEPDETEWLLCDKLPVRDGTSLGEASYAIVGASTAYAKNPAITSTATAATVAGGAKYIYKLAEPQTIDLGTVDLPKLRKKPLVNTIWANGTAEGTGFSLAPEIDCEYNQWSTYCDGFKTHGKHSYFDMGCCIAARDTGTPEKKSVTATVPYMSGYYDLSKLYGAIAFEARQLTYRFEFVEDSREELQQKKSQFLEWLSQVHDEEIADDDIPGRHFIGSLSEWEFEEGEEGQSGSLEVTFNCQPFLEADEDTTKTCNAGSNTVTVEGQAVNVYAKTNSGTATIRIGGVMQSVGTTEIRLSVQLQPGDNAVTVTGSPVVLRWKELTV